MDGQQDGTDVCPLRGDERRMCSSPSETQAGKRQRRIGSKAEIRLGTAGLGQMAQCNKMWFGYLRQIVSYIDI